MATKSNMSLLPIICTVWFLSIGIEPAHAIVSAGYDGINKYSHILYPNCLYGNRAGATYVSNLNQELVYYNAASALFLYQDSNAWESDLWASYAGAASAEDVNFFAFSGHGFRYDYYPVLNGASCHFYVKNGGEPWHSSSEEGLQEVNATWNEIRWGHGTNKWASFYSCNWLTNGNIWSNYEKICRMFEGLHLMTGFASIMYLDSREGTTYGFNLVYYGQTFKNAWFNAASYWQTQRTEGDSIARVQGAKSCINDTIYSWSAGPVWYIYNPDGYSAWSLTIPHDGQPK